MTQTARISQAQHAARHANDALSLLIDSATNYAIYMLDPEGRVAIWNRGAERIKGWAEDEIVGRSANVFYLPEQIAAGRLKDELSRARASGKIEEESWRVRKDGSRFLANVTVSALYGPSGDLHGFGKVVRDITEQRAAETALADRESQLEMVLDTVPDAVAVLDDRLRIISFSRTAERLFGHAEADVVGHRIDAILVAAGEVFVPAGVDDTPITDRRVIGLRADGSTFPFALTLGCIQTSAARRFTAFMHDLSERERTDARLARLQNELFHVARVSALGAMGSTLAHELNQPITAVANYAQAARDLIAIGGRQDEADEALRHVVDAALRAGGIVRQLRNFIARGEVDARPCDLSALIRDTLAIAAGILHDQAIVTRWEVEAGLPRVMVERIQIQQVLLNLVRNAADAMASSSPRRLSISARRRDDCALVTVADTGPGIAPAMTGKLFEAFTSSKPAGMGVGLSICRTIVEAHGCAIWIETDGGGARISFTLPLLDGDDGLA